MITTLINMLLYYLKTEASQHKLHGGSYIVYIANTISLKSLNHACVYCIPD